jgi:ribosomal protein L21E
VARFSRVIPPGGEGWIELNVNTKNYRGNITKSATVHCNDPENSTVRLIIKANIKVLIYISKRNVYLRGNEGDTISTIVTVRAEKAEPLKLELKNFNLSDKVQLRIEEVDKGKMFKLIFTGKTGLVGRHKGVLNLTTNYPEKPEISLPVAISIKKRNN